MLRTICLFLVFGLFPSLALACDGDESGDREGTSEVLQSVLPEHLALMVLGHDDLGEGLAYFEASASFRDNEGAAFYSFDPADTAADLDQLGRVAGYSQTFTDPDLAALELGEGLISLSMDLDLFESRSGARRFLAKQSEDFQRLNGSTLANGVTLEDTEVFDVEGVGDEAVGLRARATYQGVEFYQTIAAFRIDRLVAAVAMYEADSAEVRAQAEAVAGALANKVTETSLAIANPTARGGTAASDGETAQGSAPRDFAGEWRVFSSTLFYDAGGSGGSDASASTTRRLILKQDGTWEFGSSSGRWYVASIAGDDWERWGSDPYGPTRKIVLKGWNGGVGDGPIEEYKGGVDFFWIIYRVDAPSPGIVQVKFGHS